MNINIYGDVHIVTDKYSKKSNKKIRTSKPMTEVKKKVKGRDMRCQCCENETVPLEVHHILNLADYPELAADESNLISLCQKCHVRYHKEYDDANAVTFAEFMKRFGERYE